jgi:hypothetical protein
MSKAVGGEERDIRNTYASAVWQVCSFFYFLFFRKIWTLNWYIWLFVSCVICHVLGTLHGVGHLSVSRLLSGNVTHVKIYEAGTLCVCTRSRNVCQINLSWKQYGIYLQGLFRVHSYWRLCQVQQERECGCSGMHCGRHQFQNKFGAHPASCSAVPRRGIMEVWKISVGVAEASSQRLHLSVYWSFMSFCVIWTLTLHCKDISSY